MSVISNVSNFTRLGDNLVNVVKMFQYVYALIVSDNNSEKITKIA